MTDQNTNITKAIIPVAGWGTRRLPITKAIEKCMLPIGNRPVVDYAVEECVLAGIEDIFFVVSPDFEQLRSYYTANTPLEEYLAERGKTELLENLRTIPHKANFHYIVQDPTGPYGTSVPVWVARDAVQHDDHFVVMFGDSFVFNKDGTNEIARLKQAVATTHAAGAILGVELDEDRLSKCGVIKSRPGAEDFDYLDTLVEKPALGTAPSNLANVTYLVLSSGIMPFVERTLGEVNAHGEHFLTDAITSFAANNDVLVVPSTGQYLDGGELEGWIKANQVMLESQKSQ